MSDNPLYLPESFHVSKSIKDTCSIAAGLLQEIEHRERKGATVLALSGDLGAGKTSFSQCIAKSLGVVEPVTSPTYVIMKAYDIKSHGFSRIVHIDAYRLQSENDLSVLGWNEVVKDHTTLMIIEWYERIEKALPSDAIRFRFETINEYTRTIEIHA